MSRHRRRGCVRALFVLPAEGFFPSSSGLPRGSSCLLVFTFVFIFFALIFWGKLTLPLNIFSVRGREGVCLRVPRRRPPALSDTSHPRVLRGIRGSLREKRGFRLLPCGAAAILAALCPPTPPASPAEPGRKCQTRKESVLQERGISGREVIKIEKKKTEER